MLKATGLQILSVFQRTADRVKGGAAFGTADGAAALAQARTIGQPSGTAIYYAVDYDAPARDYDTVEAYLRAAAEQMPGYKLGVYGKHAVVEEMAKRIPGIYCWQTYAWSRSRVSDQAAVYQRLNDVTVNGHNIDWNDQYKEAGLWPAQQPQPITTKEGKPAMKVEDANKITGLLGKVWFLLQEAGASKAELNEIGRLADEVRVAAGLSKKNS